MRDKEAIKHLKKIKQQLINNNLFRGITQAEDKQIQAIDKAIKIIDERIEE